jgi:hypothetical protein
MLKKFEGLVRIPKLLASSIKNDSAQGIVEYLLILALVVFTVVGLFAAMIHGLFG